MRSPAERVPASGSAAALTGAMAAELVAMTARATTGWADAAGVAAQARTLSARLVPLAAADADALYARSSSSAPTRRRTQRDLGPALERRRRRPARHRRRRGRDRGAGRAGRRLGGRLRESGRRRRSGARRGRNPRRSRARLCEPDDRRRRRARPHGPMTLVRAAADARAAALETHEPGPAWSLPAEDAASIGCRSSGRSSRRGTGRSAAPPVAASVCASSTAASTHDASARAPLASAVGIELGDDGEIRVVPDELGDVCGHGTALRGRRPRSRARLRDPQRPRSRRRRDGQRRPHPRGSALRDRAGLRRDQHEPLDDEEAVRRDTARPRRRRLLPPHRARRRRPQHAGRELSRGASRR